MSKTLEIERQEGETWIEAVKRGYDTWTQDEKLKVLFTHKILRSVPKSRRKIVAAAIVPHLESIKKLVRENSK